MGCKIIMDHSNLENVKTIEIFAAEENLPPVPHFNQWRYRMAILTSQFYFDCWGSRDDIYLASSKIFLRWDWDNDGVWDTPYSRIKIYYPSVH